MDTALRSVPLRDHAVAEPSATISDATRVEPSRLLAVTATYLLSENGRKTSLLQGGDGRAQQRVTLQVPTTRLHLVTVNAEGNAHLKLRPRYECDDQQRVRRIDTVPTYDVPPTIDDLLRDAARNYELERVFTADRTAFRSRQRDAERDLRAQLAQSFLTDRSQRALVHPAPSHKRCFLKTDTGRILFDIAADEGLAKDVPPEANRRFRADLVARREDNRQSRAAQLALHEEKKQFLADWITSHGTTDQQERQAAGVLPMNEAIEALTDDVMAPINDRPRYQRDGVHRLQMHLRSLPSYREVVIAPSDLLVVGSDVRQATAAEWTCVRALQAALPAASVTLRTHRLAWRQDAQAPTLQQRGVIVSLKYGPFVLRREYEI